MSNPDEGGLHSHVADLMRHRNHELLAETIEGTDQRHAPDQFGNCTGCWNEPEWPCADWLESNSRVIRWLCQQLETTKEDTDGA